MPEPFQDRISFRHIILTVDVKYIQHISLFEGAVGGFKIIATLHPLLQIHHTGVQIYRALLQGKPVHQNGRRVELCLTSEPRISANPDYMGQMFTPTLTVLSFFDVTLDSNHNSPVVVFHLYVSRRTARGIAGGSTYLQTANSRGSYLDQWKSGGESKPYEKFDNSREGCDFYRLRWMGAALHPLCNLVHHDQHLLLPICVLGIGPKTSSCTLSIVRDHLCAGIALRVLVLTARTTSTTALQLPHHIIPYMYQ